jgi:hypothetical protein
MAGENNRRPPGAARSGGAPPALEPEVIEASGNDTSIVMALARGELTEQIRVAKQYPRSTTKFQQLAMSLATANPETARSCGYALPRKDKDGKEVMIKGPSIRLAEILAHAYQNVFAGGRPIGEEGGFVICQGICWDIENNVRIILETRRKITKSNGARYSDDMVTVTSNAGTSIALRNAILHVIPKVWWEPIYAAAMKTAVGDQKTIDERRKTAIDAFGKMGIAPARVFARVGVKGMADITIEHLEILLGLFTSIKEEGAKLEDIFPEEQPAGDKAEPTMADAIEDALDAVTQEPADQEKIRQTLAGKSPADQLVTLRAAKGKPEMILVVDQAGNTSQPAQGSGGNGAQTVGDRERAAINQAPSQTTGPAAPKASRFKI